MEKYAPVVQEQPQTVAAPVLAQGAAQPNLPQLEVSSSTTNLDIPAFMRRRYRFSG
jgi:hypothetical protein